MRMTSWWMIGCALVALVLGGCVNNNDDSPTSSGTEPTLPGSNEKIILSAAYTGYPAVPFGSTGDVWMSTWGDDDMLYITWGDGSGPGQDPTNPTFQTDAGVAGLEGALLDFTNVGSPFECIRSLHVPDGIGWQGEDDKPSSIICIGGRLYFAGHTPMGDPDYGYIAHSDDHGFSWTEVPDSPWTRDNSSPFRVIMFINMGQNYEFNSDGYVYGLAIGTKFEWEDGSVRLCRVQKDDITEYDEYRYFTGTDSSGSPLWAEEQGDAVPVEELTAYAAGSAMFHDGSQHYLFMTKNSLCAATNPWGPWYKVRFTTTEYDDSWEGGYMPGLIAKDAGSDYFYFTVAGSDSVISYGCHFGKIELELAEIIP